MPMFGQIKQTFSIMLSSIKGEAAFFSVAMTMPLVAVFHITAEALRGGRGQHESLITPRTST